MSEKVNEMNLPVISLGAMTAPKSDMPTEYGMEEPSSNSVVMGTPHREHDPCTVSVYAESISPSGAQDPSCPVCTFDVVFSVGIFEENVSKTYRVVKRIGIDKCKIACDAECTLPVSIVETKTEEDKKQGAALMSTKRFKVLAGLE